MLITKLEQIVEMLKNKPKKRLVVVYGQDSHSIGSTSKAIDLGIVDVTLVGDEKKIKKVCNEMNIDPNKFTIVNEPEEIKSGLKAVQLINEGKGNAIMKGIISTDNYMRVLLNKEVGLVPKGSILSHITVVENPNMDRLLVVGDVAIIPYPDLKQKIAIANYLINTTIKLGVEKPKLAVIAATEKANPKMPACVDASILSKMGDRGQIKNAIIDGPLALDVAIDKESAEIKGLKGEVPGNADCLLFPNIEAGNVFYKSMTKLANSPLAAIVAGAKVPAILSSRGDSEETKLYSIALATLLG